MQDTRPSKKQRELLEFIDGFIRENGYGPSYREVMRALDYKSVSTVAVHVDGLIARGFLRKTDHSARSLEVVTTTTAPTVVAPNKHIEWITSELEKREALADEVSKKEAKIISQALLILNKPRE